MARLRLWLGLLPSLISLGGVLNESDDMLSRNNGV
jgi:hypothetical protein